MATSSIGQLDSQYTNIINNMMIIERQPLTRLTEQRDTINVQRGIYTDLKEKLDSLFTAVHALRSTDPFYNLMPGRKVAFSSTFVTAGGLAWNGAIATASASASAVPASYTMAVTSIARQHRVYSDQVPSIEQDLNLAGAFLLGGAADRSANLGTPIAATVTAAGTASLDGTIQELGSGNYKVEVRSDATAGWQFRMVDADGKTVSVRLSDGSGYSDTWQSIPKAPEGSSDPVTYDTGRGLTLTFNADQSGYTAGTAQVSYTAKGTSITVADGDTLNDLVEQINGARYAEGMGVTATIIDRQLVLTSERTGLAHTIVAEHQSGTDVLASLGIKNGTGFLHTMQTAADAVFTINNVEIRRSRNDNLTDVISGVNLTLSSEAEGKTTTLNINADHASQRQAINTFISSFNAFSTYLKAKTEVVKQEDGSYKRNPLSGDVMFSTLRTDLFRLVNGSVVNAGTLKSLREIGIELNDDLSLTIKDSAALDKALNSDFDNVKLMMDEVMGKIDAKLSRYAGSSKYVDQMIKTTDQQTKDLGKQISDMETRLDARKEFLTNQYAEAQAQLYMLMYTQQQMSSIYGSMNFSA